MTISLLRHTFGSGKDGATSAGIDTTGASLLVLNVAYQQGVAVTVADSKGNTWRPLTAQASNPVVNQLFYAWNPIVGTGHTFTVSGTGAFPSFDVGAFVGVLTASDPLDTPTVTYGAGGNATQIGIGAASLTPSNDNSLVLSGMAFNPTVSNFQVQGGLSAVDFVNMGSSDHYGSALNYVVQTTKATISNATPVASWTTAATVAFTGVAFKYDSTYSGPAGTGGGATVNETAASNTQANTSGTGAATVTPAGNAPAPTIAFGMKKAGRSIYNFRDNVMDSAAAVGTASFILSNSTNVGYANFSQSGYTVGESLIPYVAKDTHGNVEGGTATYTNANTLTRDVVLNSSNNGDPVTFSGPVTIYVDIPASLFNVFVVESQLDLRKFGADKTFAKDSTTAVQTAILEAINSGISDIVCDVGRYQISGPLVGSGNCQIYFPQTGASNPGRSVRFIGRGMPNAEQQGLWNVPPTMNGVIFESTIQGANNNPAVFGFEQGNPGDAAYGLWSYLNASFTNLCVRTRANQSGAANSMSAFNFQFASQLPLIDQVRIDVSRGLQDMVMPTTGSCGIITPPIDNHALLQIGFVLVSGYNTAVVMNEHTDIRKLQSVGNVNGVVLKGANHASSIHHYLAEWTQNSFVMQGDHALQVTLYDTEHNTGTNFSHQSDFNYQSGSRKIGISHARIVVQGSSTPGSFVTNDTGGAHYKIFLGDGAN
jgi:hypothetical protein